MNVPRTPPAATAWLFPEYDFSSIDLETHRSVIIERILERGSWGDFNWLTGEYGEDRIKQWLRRHGFRALSGRSFALWRLVFGLERWEAPEWARAKERAPW